MDLGTALAGSVLGIDVFEEYVRGLQRIGTIPSAFDGMSNGTSFTVTIEPLEFEMAKPAGDDPYTRLHLTGTVALGAPQLTVPLDTWVRLRPELRPAPNQPIDANVLTFAYDGVDVGPSPPLTEAMIDDVFGDGPIANIITSISIPLLDSLIRGVGDALFGGAEDDDPAPPSGLWQSELALMPADANQDVTVDALGFFVALPDGDATPGDTASFLPRLTEFGIVYSRAFLDAQFEEQDMSGDEIDGALITEFSLVMGESELLIDGRATKDIADIHFAGPITVELIRGTPQFFVDTSGVDVDVDLPWWADVFLFLAGDGGFLSFGLIPIFGSMIIDAATGTTVSEAQAEIGAAPAIVHGAISSSLTGGLAQLAQALSNLGPLGALQPASTPESSLVENGSIAVFAQVFINPVTETITDGMFSRRANRLLELQLQSGRRFTTSELARIVDLGLILTPGYHAVAPHIRDGVPVRGYMQDNPDGSDDDNLLVRFGP